MTAIGLFGMIISFIGAAIANNNGNDRLFDFLVLFLCIYASIFSTGVFIWLWRVMP